MSVVRVTKEFTFEMAHALDCHDGKCRNIHGHSYHLSVTVKGTPIANDQDPKNGMIIDFGDLKKVVKDQIVNQYDHALVLWEHSPFNADTIRNHTEKLILHPFQPTCENLILFFAERLKNTLPLHLVSLKLRETATSYAEWFAEDE